MKKKKTNKNKKQKKKTIGANIGSCPRTTLPLPHGFFHLASLSRSATSHWARAIVFFIICGHFDHGCRASLREQIINETARIEMHLSQLVKTIL